MAKINDMNESVYIFLDLPSNDFQNVFRAISKIRSYDDFVPYYHQFIEQMANLLGKI